MSFLFFLSLALGALFFVLIQYATQGGWGIVVRRIGETVFATVPVMAALFVPVLFGLHDLYSWSVPGAADHDALLRWKAPYLNVPFFLIRAALYFGCWSFIALLYYRRSRGQDATGDPAVSARLRRFAGPAIIVLALTQTFASVDWIMSLTPHWYSTMFGVYFFAGSFVGFIALLSVVAVAMRRAGLLDTVISAEHLHDIGKLLFAFTAFWTYIAFCQFFLIWYANLPEETIWYRARMEGSWMTVSLFLMAGHFVVPFFYLMGSAPSSGRDATLAVGGAWLLAMHFVDLYWQVMPTLHPEGVRPSALDVAALLADRRVLRGGGGLADATAGARTATRPEAGRIARVRERLRSGRESRVESAGATAEQACPDGGSGVESADCRMVREREASTMTRETRFAMTKELSMRGTGNRLWLAAGLVAVLGWPSVAVAAQPSREPSPSPGNPPRSSRSTWPPRPSATRSTGESPRRTRRWFSAPGNTMGNIMVWVSKGLPAGKTWPAPKTPVTLDQDGCEYKPHVMGIMVGQAYRILNSDGILHNIHTLPKINPSFNRGQPATVKEMTTTFPKPENDVPGQVRRPPVDERLHRRLYASLLLGDEHGREVHDLGS